MEENQPQNISTSNPLSKHFRQPSIYYKLPSKGKYWPKGAVNLGSTGELAVMPMTTRDEITLRTPDALMNGQGVVDVIQSCVPDIKDAWNMPSMDLDSTMISIRIASYGENMELTSDCPTCKESGDYQINLPNCLDSIQEPDYSTPVEINELLIKLKPQTYFNYNKNNILAFEEEQIIRTLGMVDSLPEEEIKKRFEEHLKKVVELNVELLASNTEYIEVDGQQVYDLDHIREFYTNTDTKVVKAIQNKIEQLSDQASIKPQEVTCANCSATYSLTINFDYASFFAVGS